VDCGSLIVRQFSQKRICDAGMTRGKLEHEREILVLDG
jgi:hypothetical protein